MPHAEKTTAVMPGSALERAIAVLDRPARRNLLASIQTTNPKRAAKLQRRAHRDLGRAGFRG